MAENNEESLKHSNKVIDSAMHQWSMCGCAFGNPAPNLASCRHKSDAGWRIEMAKPL